MISARCILIGLACSLPISSQPGDWRKIHMRAGLDPDGSLNTLSDSELKTGWELLFDGKSMQGWKKYGGTTLPAGWFVSDNAIHKLAGGGDIISARKYSDFVWAIDWKISAGGNSGLFYRGVEAGTALYWNALEMQVLDNDGHPDGKNPRRMAGANYDMYAPMLGGREGYDATFKKDGKPEGYNKVLVVVHGHHHSMWLNGVKVVTFELGSADWNARRTAGKFSGAPGYGAAMEGFFGLQDHTNEVWFRNIKVRPLPPNPGENEIWPNNPIPPAALLRRPIMEIHRLSVYPGMYSSPTGPDMVRLFDMGGKRRVLAGPLRIIQ